jgi:hypothetical protein
MKGVLAALLLGGCHTSSPSTEGSSLRVPMPEGWKAAAHPGGLHVGPPGRVVLHLETNTNPLPELEALLRALEAEHVEIRERLSLESFVGARYLISKRGAAQEAFLGVRRAGPRTVWCSTTPSARVEEVDEAVTICRSLSWAG